MDFSQLTMDNFLKTLSSKEPTPGGGSTAGLSASLSASLVLMVVNLTDENDFKLSDFKLELERIRNEAQELINEDSEAFQEVMAAYRLPKGTEEEKDKRHNHIQLALKDASIVPFKTMKLGLRLLEIGKQAVQFGNPNAISDVGVAALMALSAVKGGYYNVLINIKSLDDKECSSSINSDADNIMKKAELLQKEIEFILLNKLA